MALVTPVLKKPQLDQNIQKNYRPISNLHFISKILEKIVAHQLVEHLNNHQLLDQLQSAYRKQHSTETALVKVKSDLLKAADDRKVSILVLLDLSAAFDTIDHTILFDLLCYRFGVNGSALQWLTSYLTNRKQTVIFDGSKSTPMPIKYGVPQGSVLGPLLFSIYTTPLGDIMQQHGIDYHLYADDCQVYVSFDPTVPGDQRSAVTRIESCIRDVRQWMSSKALKLNDEKTELSIIGNRRLLSHTSDITLNIGDMEVHPSDSVRNLGVIIDTGLTMQTHVNSVCRSCFHSIRSIGRIRSMLNYQSTKNIVQASVISELDYCNSLLYGIPQYLSNKLLRVQRTAARLISRVKKYDSITPTMKALHWLPISYRVQFKLMCLTYRCLTGDAPSYLANEVSVYQSSRTLRSSSQNLLSVPKTNLQQGSHAFGPAAARLWNDLPHGVKEAKTLTTLKKRLKTHYFISAYEGAQS